MDRAEAAFGHLQLAAREVFAAAHDALDLLEQVVTTTGLGEILEGASHLSRSLFPRPGPRPAASAARPAAPRTDSSPVERISVR